MVCLTVLENQAGLTGHIEMVKTASSTQSFVAGNFVNTRLTDNGSPGTLDLVNFDLGTPTQSLATVRVCQRAPHKPPEPCPGKAGRPWIKRILCWVDSAV